MLNIRLFQAALALYGLGTLGYLAFLATQRDGAARLARLATGLGVLAHTGFFLARWAASGYFPITNLFESLNFFSWAIVVSFIVLQIRFTAAVLGAIVMPIAFLLAAFSLTLDAAVAPLAPALQSRWLYVHTTLAFLGDAFFVIAFAGGVLYLVQERQLKSRHTGAFFHRLPSLDLLDRINYRSLTFGFPLLTLGIITGAIWAEMRLGLVLAVGPEGDLVADHLVHLRRPRARPPHGRLARAQGGLALDRRVPRGALHLPRGEPAPRRPALLREQVGGPAMDIIVLGLNHKTAPVHIRERVAFPEKSIHEPLRALRGVRRRARDDDPLDLQPRRDRRGRREPRAGGGGGARVRRRATTRSPRASWRRTSTCTPAPTRCATSSAWPRASTRWSSASRRSSGRSRTPTSTRARPARSAWCSTGCSRRRSRWPSSCAPRPRSPAAPCRSASRRSSWRRRSSARSRGARR